MSIRLKENPSLTRARIPYGLFIILLAADVSVMVLEKIAAETVPGEGPAFFAQLLFQPLLWLALACALVQLASWLKILKVTDLSLAYPIASLGYPLTMLAAQVFLGEHLNAQVWLGGMSITAGVVLLGASHKGKSQGIDAQSQ